MPLHRRRARNLETDLIMVAGLIGIHPSQIGTYTLLVTDTAGEGWIVTPGCCAHHAWMEATATFSSVLDDLPPCSGDDG